MGIFVRNLILLGFVLALLLYDLIALGGWQAWISIGLVVAFLALAVKSWVDMHPRVPKGIKLASGRAFTIDPQEHFTRVGVASGALRFSVGRDDQDPRVMAPEAREAFARIFNDYGAIQVFCGGGSLVALVPTTAVKWRARYEILLGLLDKAARAIEPVPLHVQVLGGERRALAGHGTPRCAYCHEDVTGNEPDLVACRSCSTVLHEGCWGELGRCPVLGCEGTSPERARVGLDGDGDTSRQDAKAPRPS